MNKIQKFLKKSFNNNKEMVPLFIGTMIFNSIVSHYGNLKAGTPLFMVTTFTIIIGGLLLYRRKDKVTNVKDYSKSSILKDLTNKVLMFIGVFILLFIFSNTNIIPKIIIYLENSLRNTVSIFVHLAVLYVLCKAMDNIRKNYGKKDFIVIILGIIYINISIILNVDYWTTFLGCVSIMDIYLNYKQYIAIICLPFIITKYLVKRFEYVK